MYERLKHHLKEYTSVSEEKLNDFCQLFEEKSVKKKEFLLQEGEICSFEAFIVKGLFKVFLIDENDNEHILYFGAENWWVMDFDSFENENASKLNIQALEESQILYISKKNKEKAFLEMLFYTNFFTKPPK